MLGELAVEEGIVRAQLWTAATGKTRADTVEAGLRGGDKLIAGALVVECVRFDDAERVAARLNKSMAAQVGISGPAALGIYGLLCILDKGSLARV
jgi:hypothetical protein